MADSNLYGQTIASLANIEPPLSSMIGGAGTAGCATDTSQGWYSPSPMSTSTNTTPTSNLSSLISPTSTTTSNTTTSNTTTSNTSNATSPAQAAQSTTPDSGGINYLSASSPAITSVLGSLGNLLTGNDANLAGGLGNSILPTLTNILGQSTGSPVWGTMANIAAPTVGAGISALTGQSNVLLDPLLQNTTSLADSGLGFSTGLVGKGLSALGLGGTTAALIDANLGSLGMDLGADMAGMAGADLGAATAGLGGVSGSVGFIDPMNTMIGMGGSHDQQPGALGWVQNIISAIPFIGQVLGGMIGEIGDTGAPPEYKGFYKNCPAELQAYNDSWAINDKMQSYSQSQGWTPYQLAQYAESQGLVAVPAQEIAGDVMMPTGDVQIWTPQAYYNYAAISNSQTPGRGLGATWVDTTGFAGPGGNQIGYTWQMPETMGTVDSTIYPTEAALNAAVPFNQRLSGNLQDLLGSPNYVLGPNALPYVSPYEKAYEATPEGKAALEYVAANPLVGSALGV